MAAIFPPEDMGGVPPGPNVVNGFTPDHAVIGEGPLYIAPDCTTTLTAGQVNAIASELLAAVDRLGFSFNTNSITNLGDALVSMFADLDAGKVSKSGDTMTGPLVLSGDPTDPLGASTKQYTDQQFAAAVAQAIAADDALRTILQGNIDQKVNRAGDTMGGQLGLVGDPVAPTHAASKHYVDSAIAAAGGGGGGSGIPDAPSDGTAYGRKNMGWTRVLELVGGTLTGPLILSGPPTDPLGATTKQYVDDAIASAQPAAGAVRYDIAQNLSEAQDAQARINVDAAPFDAMAYNNIVINGGCDVAQEGGGVVPFNGYVIDMWTSQRGGTWNATAQRVSDAPPGLISSIKATVSVGNAAPAAADYLAFRYNVEGIRIARLAFGTANARPLSIGFWVKAHRPGLRTGAALNNAVTRACPFTYEINAADTWEFKTITLPGDVAGAWVTGSTLGMILMFPLGIGANLQGTPNVWQNGNFWGAAGVVNGAQDTTDTFQITGLIVLPGIEMPSAARATLLIRPYDQELLLCYRYLAFPEGGAQAMAASASQNWGGSTQFRVQMRGVPAVAFFNWIGNANVAAIGIALTTTNSFVHYCTSVGAGGLQYNAVFRADARL